MVNTKWWVAEARESVCTKTVPPLQRRVKREISPEVLDPSSDDSWIGDYERAYLQTHALSIQTKRDKVLPCPTNPFTWKDIQWDHMPCVSVADRKTCIDGPPEMGDPFPSTGVTSISHIP